MIRMALRLRGVRVLMDRGQQSVHPVPQQPPQTQTQQQNTQTQTQRSEDIGVQDAFITGMIYALSKRLLPGAPYAPGQSGSGAAEASRSEGGRWKLGECLTRRLAGGASSPLIFPALPSDLWSRGTVLSMVCRALGRVPDLLRARRACLHTSRLGCGLPKGGWRDELR
jgi:hypothetical protein